MSPEGETLARHIRPLLPAVAHVYCSPLRRCTQTAALVWSDVETTEIAGLRETDFGPFEGKNHAELKDDPLYQQWISGKSEIPGVENADRVWERACQSLNWLLVDAAVRGFSRAGVVSHGGTLMSLLWKFGHPAKETYYGWQFPNCGGFWVRVQKNPLTLEILKPVGNGAESASLGTGVEKAQEYIRVIEDRHTEETFS